MLRSMNNLLIPEHARPSRRRFIGQVLGSLAAAKVARGLTFDSLAAQEGRSEAGSKLIVRTAQPLNAEPSLPHLLDHWLTDNGLFFQRCHGNLPKIEQEGYRLSIEGLVERPLELSLAELKHRFPEVAAAVSLTCAGNRRREFPAEKKIAGVQWDAGAISTADWRGVKLSDVLQHAGLKPEAKHIWFEGRDEVQEGGKTIFFGGSIPVDKALSATKYTPGAMLVHSMNDRPLPLEHGAPLRAVVPGYIGARSVKWLGKIIVSEQPSPNHFLAKAYKVLATGTPEETQATGPIYQSVINSVICNWSLSKDKSRISVQGFALPSGRPECLIRDVQVSTDDGQTWTPARLTSPQREFCWSFWEAGLPGSALGQSVLVKATDSQGESQPREMTFNVKGYQYNAWHRTALKS